MSAVPAAKAAIKALMEAHTWPVSAPVIRWGGPTESEDMSGELVYFGDTPESDDEYTVLGATRIDENFTVRIVIDVIGWGDDEQATETRAWDLFDSLRGLLNTNRNLITQAQLNVRLEGRTFRQQNIPAPNQWIARIVVDQACVGLILNP